MSKMGNTTKILLFGLGMVIFVLMSYLIIIKPLQSNYTKLMLTQEQLQGEKKYYDSLKDASDNTSGEIDQLNSEITDVENQFLPYLNTECIEQYVMAMFEENGCPYLKSIESESIVTNDVALPDGTFSSERLVQRRITVTYSTTDGYCIPQYNTVPDNNELTPAGFDAIVATMGTGMYQRTGYPQFVNTLELLEQSNPSCIKINKVTIQDSNLGYVLMTAEIDFYGLNLTDRVSVPNLDQPYITWNGEVDVDCVGGQVGCPLLTTDPNSDWYGVSIVTRELLEFHDRPFATYFSTAIFVLLQGQYYNEEGQPRVDEVYTPYEAGIVLPDTEG